MAVMYLDLLSQEKGVDPQSAFNSVSQPVPLSVSHEHLSNLRCVGVVGFNFELDRNDRPRSVWIRLRHCRPLESPRARIGGDGTHAIHYVHYVGQTPNPTDK